MIREYGVTPNRATPVRDSANRRGRIFGSIRVDPVNTHIAFLVKTRTVVNTFHQAALAADGKDNGKPGLRPQYSANYYAAFVLDADGYNIEAMCREAE